MVRSEYTVQIVEWNLPEAEAAKRIRFEVFVDEQRVPAELELDHIDSTACHVLAFDREGRPCGTGRLFADPEHPECAHIGRMAVVQAARGSGCGSALLTALMEEARRRGFERITLSAQTHALPFYERHGFQAEGDIYDDAGIPHRRMSLSLSPA